MVVKIMMTAVKIMMMLIIIMMMGFYQIIILGATVELRWAVWLLATLGILYQQIFHERLKLFTYFFQMSFLAGC